MDIPKKKKKILDRMKQEQKIKQELVRLTDIVRKKYKTLVRDEDRAERLFEAQARPIVVPLQKTFLDTIKQTIVPKQEPKTEEDEMSQPLETSIQTTPESQVSKYLKKLSSRSDNMDSVYGVRADGRGGLVIGDSKIKFSKSKVLVGDKMFDATPGLLELLFMQVPDKNLITTNDLSGYKEILSKTNAHRQSYSRDKNINSNRGKKYTSVISVLFPPKKTAPEGHGLFDVNGLVKRLKVLILSKSAGHTAHDEEIANIIDTLKKYKVIA